jgi:hypothetical protein
MVTVEGGETLQRRKGVVSSRLDRCAVRDAPLPFDVVKG